MNRLFKTAYYILIAGIASVAILLAVSVFPIPGNYEVKIVLSGSMEPAIKTGSVVVIKPSDNYKIGDIITFGKDTKKDIPTTHRIIEARAVEGKMLYKTKGDANKSPDTKEVREKEIVGKEVFTIPFLGYLLEFAKKPIGFLLIIIVPALAVAGDEVKKIWKEVKRLREKKKNETV
ncbi:MAG: signal peptidase I [bacterium]|nr:signal peptidase I [bacterium]